MTPTTGGAGYDISVATSTPTNSNTGGSDFIITGGGSGAGGSTLFPTLPKVSTDKAWVVWVVAIAAVGAVVYAVAQLFRR